MIIYLLLNILWDSLFIPGWFRISHYSLLSIPTQYYGESLTMSNHALIGQNVQEMHAKTILYYHDQTFSTNWDANIYRGCEHNCRYCFAQYSHRYLVKKQFFNDIYVKANAPALLAKELGKKTWNKHPVNVCGISDCYQPAEARYKIMPKVIKSFIRHQNPLVIVTKSTLPLRDIALLQQLNEVAEVSIIGSVSTLDEDKRKLIEPNTAPTRTRLTMLKKFAQEGFQTAVLFMPILPYLSDDTQNMEEIFRLTKEYQLGSINGWPLHLRGENKGVFFTFLQKSFPALLPKYEKLYKTGMVSPLYQVELQKKLSELNDKFQLYSTYSPTRPKKSRTGTQRTLFDI